MAYYLRNTKFKSLLNQFKNYNHEYTLQKLEQIQSNYNYSLAFQTNVDKKHFLESLFKKTFYNKPILTDKPIQLTRSKPNSIREPIVEQHLTKQVAIDKPIVYKECLIVDKPLTRGIEEIVYKPKYTSELLEKLSKQFIVLETRKNSYDRYSTAYFQCLSNNFAISQDKQGMLKETKLEIISIFRKEQLYKLGTYSAKDFKKSDIDEILTENRDIPMKMLKVYGDVLDTNVVYINLDDMSTTYLNTYVDKRATVLIAEDRDKLYSIKHKNNNYILGSELKGYLSSNAKIDRANLEKKLLEEIQNIALSMGISIKKTGKTGLINKKKEEIIEEIVSK